jgi:hypothetical protein
MKTMLVECTPLAEEVIKRLVLTGDCIVKPIHEKDEKQPTDLMEFYATATSERSAAWDIYLEQLKQDWK